MGGCPAAEGSDLVDARKLALEHIGEVLSAPMDRAAKAKEIAAAVRTSGDYRWAGIYEVDRQERRSCARSPAISEDAGFMWRRCRDRENSGRRRRNKRPAIFNNLRQHEVGNRRADSVAYRSGRDRADRCRKRKPERIWRGGPRIP
jgi:hypothetical protein